MPGRQRGTDPRARSAQPSPLALAVSTQATDYDSERRNHRDDWGGTEAQGLSALLVEIEACIRRNVEELVQERTFQDWLADEKSAEGDLVLLNNSFVYRERVKTTKSPQYLCMRCNADGRLETSTLTVTAPVSFNSDFKRLLAKSANLPKCEELSDAIRASLTRLGPLVFVLVGTIEEGTENEGEIEHALFKVLRYSPEVPELVRIVDGSVIITNNLRDPEAVWTELQLKALEQNLISTTLPQSLEAPFLNAFQALQKSSYSLVRMPDGSSAVTGPTILGQIADTLDHQCGEYSGSLLACGGVPNSNNEAFNNVLRIAYNFACDATRFIELLVSLCDIKPIILWSTLQAHYRLAEAFRALPSVKKKGKLSFNAYQSTICDARNHAFHDFFPFHRTLEVDLAGIPLAAHRLRLFTPHSGSKKNADQFTYEDREIVDILTQFTRAPETVVPAAFWTANLDVMQATTELFRATEGALKMLQAMSPRQVMDLQLPPFLGSLTT